MCHEIHSPGGGPIKVAVFLPNWIGDVAMSTPTIRAIRQHFGDAATITGIQRPYVSDVLAGTGWLTDCIEFNPKSKLRAGRRGTLGLAREMYKREFDLAIILPNSPRPALAAYLARIPIRLGYVRYGRGPLLTHKCDPPRQGRRLRPISALDYYLDLVSSYGIDTFDRSIALGSTTEADLAADRIWQELSLNGKHVVAFNTGGAYGAAKSWPAEHFADLAKRLTRQSDTRVIIVCGPAEREAADKIKELTRSPFVHSLSNQALSIPLTKALIKRSSLLVTTDSGPRFFGTAFGIPTFTIFGSTDPAWSETGHPLEFNLNIDVDCGPCAQRVCPLKHHRCMRDLTPERVFGSIQRILESVRRNAA